MAIPRARINLWLSSVALADVDAIGQKLGMDRPEVIRRAINQMRWIDRETAAGMVVGSTRDRNLLTYVIATPEMLHEPT